MARRSAGHSLAVVASAVLSLVVMLRMLVAACSTKIGFGVQNSLCIASLERNREFAEDFRPRDFVEGAAGSRSFNDFVDEAARLWMKCTEDVHSDRNHAATKTLGKLSVFGLFLTNCVFEDS